MLPVVEERVGKVEEPMEDAKELHNALGESIEDLREWSRDFVTMCLTSHRDSTERNNALEARVKALKEETIATMMALSTRIEELEGELLGLGKDKLGPSKSKVRGVCEKDNKEDNVNGNGNDNNSGNGKPRKFTLKKKPVGKALGLGSSARGVEAKEAESEKKLVECFLCHGGPYLLRKCLKNSIIEGDDGTDKEPKKLGSSKEKTEAKRAKRSKKNVRVGRVINKSSTYGRGDGVSDFKGKEVIHVGQLTRVNAMSMMVRVKRRCKQRQKCRRKGKAKASRRDQGKSSQCSKVATRALREWVVENVTDRSSKPVTITPNVSDRGLMCR
ncbi:hypothetical protein J1N35_006353 [Gossypium stocksii]|uniref:Uncharacterized protein n=1 Tax=Gossypium stocksii TaxID=47602 RepID=A0A9D3WG65_9ROSI|nr:hypothetical protein J1N35_006353 [Gossypium stocksii]